MEKEPGEYTEPDRADNRQLVGDHCQVGRGEADGGEAQVGKDVPSVPTSSNGPMTNPRAPRPAIRSTRPTVTTPPANNDASIPPGRRLAATPAR